MELKKYPESEPDQYEAFLAITASSDGLESRVCIINDHYEVCLEETMHHEDMKGKETFSWIYLEDIYTELGLLKQKGEQTNVRKRRS